MRPRAQQPLAFETRTPYVLPGDSPIGLRLPLARCRTLPEDIEPEIRSIPRDARRAAGAALSRNARRTCREAVALVPKT